MEEDQLDTQIENQDEEQVNENVYDNAIIKNATLSLLTDEDIIARAVGAVENAEDYNLKFKHHPPFRKGLFDDNIFGSLKVCKCGATTTPGVVCPMCGGRVLTKEEASKRMGYYQMTYPFVSQFKIKRFAEELSNFHPEFSKFVLNAKGTKVSGIEALLKSIYNAKIVYTPVNEEEIDYNDLIVFDSNGIYKVTVEYFTPEMTDTSVINWGPSGLKRFATNYKLYKNTQKSSNFILKYVNQVFFILPITKRPAIVRKDHSGKLTVSLHGINTYYRAIIGIDQKMFDLMNSAPKLADKLAIYYSMNRMIDMMFGSYKIVASSKKSLIRNLLTGSFKRSGRTNIVGGTDTPVDTVKIPRAMAYECLKTEIIDALKERGVRDPVAAYMNPTEEVNKIFEDIVDKSCVLLLRNPTLQRNNISAFKVQLWDEIVISLPILSVKLFNADFDGDQMAFFWVTDQRMVKLALDKMGPKNNWRFLKDNSFAYPFQISSLQGLYVASQVKRYGDQLKFFTSLDQLERAFENNEIEVDQLINLGGKETTYGREKISSIIKVDLDDLIGKDVPVNAKNISAILKVFETQEDGVKNHHELMLFSGHIVTFSGLTTVSLEDIFQTTPVTDKIKKIINSDMSDAVKYRELQGAVESEMMDQIKNLDSKNIIDIIQGGGKIKKSNLPPLFGPRIEYDKDRGLTVYDCSIAQGFDEGAFVSHVKENRNILVVKKTGTPASGYMSRQVMNACSSFLLTEEKSKSKNGIVSKAKYVQGRTKIDGSKVTETGDTLVRVKSCVDSGVSAISREELSSTTEVLKLIQEGDAIGTNAAMSWTESIVQSLLALKHGGAIVSPSKEKLKSISSGKVYEVTDKYIYVSSGNGMFKYIRPKNFLLSGNTNGEDFDVGSVLGYSSKNVHAEYTLESVNVLLDSPSRTDHVKKKDINRTFCYAPCDGKIVYNIEGENKNVKIGSVELPFHEDEIYIYPEGYMVTKGSRICGGVVNIDDYRKLFNNDIGWLFYIFKDQIETITGNDDKISEIHEIVFKGINVKNKFSLGKATKNPGTFINKMNYGYAKEAIREFVGEDIGSSFNSDIILMDLIDEN